MIKEDEFSEMLIAYNRSVRAISEFRSFVPKLLDDLTEREKEIITLRYGLNEVNCSGWRYDDIGKALGLTRERVRLIERKARNKIETNKKLKWKRYQADIKYIINGY